MTLILATHRGIYSDRKITCDTGDRCDPIRKFAYNEALVAGFAGDLELILESIKLVESGEENPKKIALSGVEGLIVKSGRIYMVELKKTWLRPKREAFYACGTGASQAMAFLAGRGKIRHSDVCAAFRYVARVRDDCGKGMDYTEAP